MKYGFTQFAFKGKSGLFKMGQSRATGGQPQPIAEGISKQIAVIREEWRQQGQSCDNIAGDDDRAGEVVMGVWEPGSQVKPNNEMDDGQRSPANAQLGQS